jgi:FixJ family two-component response regulator
VGTVYVVDDDPSVRRGLARLLRSAGHPVETFPSAREFLARAVYEHPACVLVDVRMPELTGFDLQETMLARGDELPMIFITGHGDIPMAVRAMQAGAHDFLTKPFEDQTLLDAVQKAISKDRQASGCRPGP